MAKINLQAYSLLLVDDVEFSRNTVKRLLESMGATKIETAPNGYEALKILRSSKPVDFVISDFNMPVMNGLQLLKAIRMGDGGVARSLPFAMLTGFSDKHLVDMALALDVNAFLVKPVSKATMTQRLEKMLERGEDDHWVKPDDTYDVVVIEEAEADDETPKITREAQQEAYKAMRRETPAVEPAGPGEIDPRQMGRTASVMRRLSSLQGKFDESDLARNINTGVDTLISDTGDKAASRIVSYLDGLVKRDILGLEDLPAVLTAATPEDFDEFFEDQPAAAEPAKAEKGKKKEKVVGVETREADAAKKKAVGVETADAAAPAGGKEGEFFTTLRAIPAGTTLTRNLDTVDGSLFMVAGTPISAQVKSILVHLESLHVLALDNVDGRDGVYVSSDAAGAAAKWVEEAEAPSGPARTSSDERKVDIAELQPGNVIARDIYTVDGRLYLPAGSQLSKRVIAILHDLDHLGHMQSQLYISA